MSQIRQLFRPKWTPAEIMLAVLFLFAPLYYHNNLGGAGLMLPNNNTIWLAALIFIAYSLNKVIRSETFLLPRYFIFIAAFPVLVIINGFLTDVEQPTQWFFRVLFILGGLAFFFSLFQHNLKQSRWDRILMVIALSGLFHAGSGLLQIIVLTIVPSITILSSNSGTPSGLFQQINNQATFLVTIIVVSFYLASRPVLYKRLRVIQILILLIILAASLTVGFSGSRIGLLSLVIAIPIILIARRKQLLRNRTFSVLLLLGLMSGFTSGLIMSDAKVIDKTIALQSGYSGSARVSIYDISINLFKQAPLYGHGLASFPRVFQHARPDYYAQYPDAIISPIFISHPHNELLLWLVEGGMTAFAGLILVLAGVILALRQCGVSRAWTYVAMLVPIGLHTQVELPFYMSALHWFVFLTIMALAFLPLLRLRHNNMTVYAQKLSVVVMLALTMIFIVFFLHSMRANLDFVALYDDKLPDKVLHIAKQNPYFYVQAIQMDMNLMFLTGLSRNSREYVEKFTEWGEQQIENQPALELYIHLISAYEFLGNTERYCAVAKEGLAIYPQSEKLKNTVKFCEY